MPPLTLIFMGTPAFALPTLKALAKSEHSVAAVYTQPPRPAGRGQKEKISPVHDYALSQGIPVFTPATLNLEEAQSRFRAHKADAAIVAAYGLLLPEAILKGTAMGCINVHPSLLPRWRGAAPIPRAVMAGDTETGIVIMQMNAGLDTGDMLMVEKQEITQGHTAGMLHDLLAERAAPLALKTLEGLRRGTLLPVKQPEAGVTYARKITKEECRMDWKQSAEALRNKIRGLSPLPGAYFTYKGEMIKVLAADICPEVKTPADVLPGTVLDHRLKIACSDGALLVLEVQRPGKKPMAATVMLQGCPIPSGTLLE